MIPRALIIAAASVSFIFPVEASIPKEISRDLIQDSAPAACNAFGLTPQAAVRERRAIAQREAEKQEALRIARQLHAMATQSPTPTARWNPQPSSLATTVTPPSRITPTELVQLGARAGVMVTADVIMASQQLTETKYYFYDPEGHLLAETMATTGTNPPIEWEYVWFGDVPVAQIHSPTNEIAYYFTDHLGTPIIQTNQQGQVIWHAEYEPFGKIFALRVGEGRYQPLRLPGQIADIGSPEPDVYYNMHRYYRSSWGRYLTPDPIGFDGGDLHLYRYAGANPLLNVDPLGLDFTNNSTKPVCAIMGGVWSVVQPSATLKGDVDAVAAPKGQVWGTPPATNRVFKWIDCFHASISDVPEKSPFVGINLTKKSSAEIDLLPFQRKCLCKAFPGMSQSMKGGPTSDFGTPPSTCP